MKNIMSVLLSIVLASAFNVAYATQPNQSAINKQNVIEFYNNAVNQKNYEAASKYLGDKYIQHNPLVSDGPEGLRAFIQFLRDKYPKAHNEIKQVFTDGDYVVLHVHSIREPGTRGRAIFDLFRLENGKIVEHWDAIQPIPEKSVNTNSMF